MSLNALLGGLLMGVGCGPAEGTFETGTLSQAVGAADTRCAPARPVQDIALGPASSGPAQLTEVNGALYFTADDGRHGIELWRTDPAAQGARLVKDINPGAQGSAPLWLTPVGGTLYFVADDGVHGLELWKTDGTEAGTALVKDLLPGTQGAFARPSSADASQPLASLGNALLFAADDGQHGAELWRTDGTPAGTALVKDVAEGAPGSFPVGLTALGGRVIFAADDGVRGRELWVTNGTAAGTTSVMDLNPGVAPGLGASPRFVALDGALYFEADDGAHGRELWRTDGTSAGTRLVRDLRPGPTSIVGGAWILGTAGGRLYFDVPWVAEGRNFSRRYELWSTDGTPEGTRSLGVSFGDSIRQPHFDFSAEIGGTFYFTVNTAYRGQLTSVPVLWQSHGTPGGTAPVRELSAPHESFGLTATNGRLVFGAYDDATGTELWTSDGHDEGRLLQDLSPGGRGSAPRSFVSVGGWLYFVADDEDTGTELWSLPLGWLEDGGRCHGPIGTR